MASWVEEYYDYPGCEMIYDPTWWLRHTETRRLRNRAKRERRKRRRKN